MGGPEVDLQCSRLFDPMDVAQTSKAAPTSSPCMPLPYSEEFFLRKGPCEGVGRCGLGEPQNQADQP